MSSTTTIKFQYELDDATTGLLADNNTKAISAQDVRTIVTSNYQPVLIFAGRIFSDDAPTVLDDDILRVQYYNQDYFESNFTNDSTSPWVNIDSGSGITPGTYTDVPLQQNAWNGTTMSTIGGDSTNATFDVTVSNAGIVTGATLKQPGVGWIGKSTDSSDPYEGQTGQLNINGNTSASLKFNGPLIQTTQDQGLNVFSMSTSATNSNHTLLNSILSATTAQKLPSPVEDPPVYITIDTNNILNIEHTENSCYVQIWRVAQ